VRKQCNLRPKAAPQGEVDSPGCEFNLVPSADERCPDRSFVGVAKLPVDKFLAVMPESIETIRVTLQSRYVPATEKGNQVGTIIRHSAAARARSRIYAQSESRAVIDCKTTQASIYHLNSQREPVCVLKESCTSLSVTKDSALTSAVIDSALACQKTNTCGSSVAFSEPHWFYCSVENCNDAHQCADDSTQPNSIAANDIVSSKLLPLTDTSGPSGAGRADGTDGAAANSGYGAATGKSGNPRAPRTKSVQ
jgi:hypothetical protein